MKIILCLLGITLIGFTESSQAQDVEWLTDQLKYRGVGCDPRSPDGAEIYVVTAGNEFSVLYTNLGRRFRDVIRRPGTAVSGCQFTLPAEVPPGYFLSDVMQTTFIYGLTKSKGVSIRIQAGADFIKVLPTNPTERQNLRAGILANEAFFPANKAVDAPLETLTTQTRSRIRHPNRRPATGPEADPQKIYERFCKRNRTRRMHYVSDVRVVVNKTRENGVFDMGIDGQDVSYSAQFGFQNCNTVEPTEPAQPTPTPTPQPPPPPPTTPGDRLGEWQSINIGQSIVSENGVFSFVMQSDSNACIYQKGIQASIWCTRSNGTGAQFVIMQKDGNLVAYAPGTRPVWQTATQGHEGTFLLLQNDGNMVIYNREGRSIWETSTARHVPNRHCNDTLLPNASLQLGQSLRSCNGRYVLAMQTDGNLVVYDGNRAIWESATAYKGTQFAIMQTDGNFVLYKDNWQPLWESRTAGHAGSYITLQDDGNLVIYNREGTQAHWDK